MAIPKIGARQKKNLYAKTVEKKNLKMILNAQILRNA
jgi:hypothetical protein